MQNRQALLSNARLAGDFSTSIRPTAVRGLPTVSRTTIHSFRDTFGVLRTLILILVRQNPQALLSNVRFAWDFPTTIWPTAVGGPPSVSRTAIPQFRDTLGAIVIRTRFGCFLRSTTASGRWGLCDRGTRVVSGTATAAACVPKIAAPIIPATAARLEGGIDKAIANPPRDVGFDTVVEHSLNFNLCGGRNHEAEFEEVIILAYSIPELATDPNSHALHRAPEPPRLDLPVIHISTLKHEGEGITGTGHKSPLDVPSSISTLGKVDSAEGALGALVHDVAHGLFRRDRACTGAWASALELDAGAASGGIAVLLYVESNWLESVVHGRTRLLDGAVAEVSLAVVRAVAGEDISVVG